MRVMRVGGKRPMKIETFTFVDRIGLSIGTYLGVAATGMRDDACRQRDSVDYKQNRRIQVIAIYSNEKGGR